jgi:hypothetical protein
MNKSAFFKIIILFVFFSFGFLIAHLSSQPSQGEEKLESSPTDEEASLEEQEEKTSHQTWVELDSNKEAKFATNQSTSSSSSKFTIFESKKITADKTRAQTGETINFSVTIKNQGTKGKYFSHLCFNHSGGVTFGCLNGPQGATLEPDKEFPLGGATVFNKPGTYSVWLTWSQDGTNFYRPINAGTAMVYIE